jgi:hypothetical protein
MINARRTLHEARSRSAKKNSRLANSEKEGPQISKKEWRRDSAMTTPRAGYKDIKGSSDRRPSPIYPSCKRVCFGKRIPIRSHILNFPIAAEQFKVRWLLALGTTIIAAYC